MMQLKSVPDPAAFLSCFSWAAGCALAPIVSVNGGALQAAARALDVWVRSGRSETMGALTLADCRRVLDAAVEEIRDEHNMPRLSYALDLMTEAFLGALPLSERRAKASKASKQLYRVIDEEKNGGG